jgi:hypothetical protein
MQLETNWDETIPLEPCWGTASMAALALFAGLVGSAGDAWRMAEGRPRLSGSNTKPTLKTYRKQTLKTDAEPTSGPRLGTVGWHPIFALAMLGHFRAAICEDLLNANRSRYKCKICKDFQIRIYLLLVLVITYKKGRIAGPVLGPALSYLTRM